MAVRPLPAVAEFPQPSEHGYSFQNGFPTPETAKLAYDAADLNRAIEAYRFFYPTVSGAAIFKGNAKIGIVPNQVFGNTRHKTHPRWIYPELGYTLRSSLARS